jgi:site-specific DNA recombinase
MPSTNGHTPKRAILYARVYRRAGEERLLSLAQQIEALRSYATCEGYEVLEEIQDLGQSGASLERPGMDRVRDLVAAGGVSVVLAQDRDRFAREPAYHYLLRREFEEHGCKIRALNDRGDESPEGELTDGILDQLAKFERAKTVERTRKGKLRKAREGKIVAPRHIPTYGFRYNQFRDSYLVDEQQMTVVRRVFRMIGAEARAIHEVKRTLEREGMPSPTGLRHWDRTTMRNMIRDDVYKPHTFEERRRLRVVDYFRAGDTRYLLEYVKCGRASSGKCRKCREGEYHGAYWYSYTWTGKKMVSKYHSKNRPGSAKGEE